MFMFSSINTGLSSFMIVSTDAVSLNREASWSTAIQDHFVYPFLHPQKSLVNLITPTSNKRTLPGSSVTLEPDANWLEAWEKNLSRQTLYNNIVKEVFNSMTRIIGWALISFVR